MFAHWAERQLLTTDNWVALVAPLPKNESVATAISDTAVNRIIAAADVQSKVASALPDKAAFLAGPLTDQIDQLATKVTKQFIMSDQFQSVWITANRTAQSRLVSNARTGNNYASGNTPAAKAQAAASSKIANFKLDLSSVKSSVITRLGPIGDALFKHQSAGGGDQEIAPADDSSSAPATLIPTAPVEVNVALKQSSANFSKIVRLTDFINGTFWLLGLTCLIGAIALSGSRRRLLLIISITLTTIALLQLIGVRALRPSIINQVQNSAYQPAASVVYDSLVATFKRSATNIFVVGTVIAIICTLTNPRLLARSDWVSSKLTAAGKSRVAGYIRSGREFIGRNTGVIIGIGAFLVLVFMAFVPDFDWQGVIRALLVIGLFAGLVMLLALRPVIRGRDPPMKHAL